MNNLYISTDNAQAQAQAVLAYLRMYSGIESSYDSSVNRFLAEPEVNRWCNGREQGYVISLRSRNYWNPNKINIAFFEHRNSDSICAVVFNFQGINPPTIDDIPKDHPYYESKWATDHTVSVGKAMEMAEWIQEYMEKWWKENSG